MASFNQLRLQIEANARYTNGENIPSPPDYPPQQPKAYLRPGVLEEGQDLGVIKVENGQFVIDKTDLQLDFDPDFGVY